MYADFIYPEYEVVRNYQRCIACRACERQCANEVHRYDADEQMMTADDAKCVNCHRCVSLCPTRALKIVRTDHTFKENANWTKDNIQRRIPPGSHGRRAAFQHGQPGTAARLLGPYPHQCLPGDEPAHRPAARTHGDAGFPGQKGYGDPAG